MQLGITVCMFVLIGTQVKAEDFAVLSGLVRLDKPLSGASVEIYDADGALLLQSENETGSTGAFLLRVAPDTFPKNFRIAFEGEYNGRPVTLVNRYTDYRPGEDSVFANALTTLSVVCAQRGFMTVEEARERIRKQLGIPTQIDLAHTVTMNRCSIFFSQKAFMDSAKSDESFEGYLTGIADRLLAGEEFRFVEADALDGLAKASGVAPQGAIADALKRALNALKPLLKEGLVQIGKAAASKAAAQFFSWLLEILTGESVGVKLEEISQKLSELSSQMLAMQNALQMQISGTNFDSRLNSLNTEYLAPLSSVDSAYDVLRGHIANIKTNYTVPGLPVPTDLAQRRDDQAAVVKGLVAAKRSTFRDAIHAINNEITGIAAGVAFDKPLLQVWSNIIDGRSEFQDDNYDLKTAKMYEFIAVQMKMLCYVIEDMRNNIKDTNYAGTDTLSVVDGYYESIKALLDSQETAHMPKSDIENGDGIVNQVGTKMKWFLYKAYLLDQNGHWKWYTNDGGVGENLDRTGFEIASKEQIDDLFKNKPGNTNGIDYLREKGIGFYNPSKSDLPASNQCNWVTGEKRHYLIPTEENGDWFHRWDYDLAAGEEFYWNTWWYLPHPDWFYSVKQDVSLEYGPHQDVRAYYFNQWELTTTHHNLHYLLVKDDSGLVRGNPRNDVSLEDIQQTFADLPDANADGVPDAWMDLHGHPEPLDSDNDGLPDAYSVLFPSVEDDPEGDSDGDGLNNLAEYELETNPIKPDTDGDGMPDLWEVQRHLNPRNSSDKGKDSDGDGSTNYGEYLEQTDPWEKPLRAGWNCVAVVEECPEPMLRLGEGQGPFVFDSETQQYRPVMPEEPLLPGQGYVVYLSQENSFNVKFGYLVAEDNSGEPPTAIPDFLLH